MDRTLTQIWVYLATSPLLWLCLTLLVYLAGHWLFEKSQRLAILNPVALAIALLIAVLVKTKTPYSTYFNGAQFVHFLLGPATVALAIPLYKHWDRVRSLALPLALGLVAGSLTAVLSAVGVAWLLGGTREVLLSLAPKSVTTPIAMGITEKIGGIPSLTAVLVILTGVLGSLFGPSLLNRLGITSDEAKGFALGVASHGIGTARAFQISGLAGAFAGLAIGLNGLFTAILVPVLVKALRW